MALPVLLILGATPGFAAEWDILTGIGVEESFSDNGNLATEDEEREAELSTVISPTISLSGRGAHTSVNLDYTLDQVINHFGDEDRTDHNLAALGQMEIWERVAFVDAQASISRQVIDASEPSSRSVAGRGQNRTQTYAFDVSPYLRHRFGNWFETEARFRYSQVNTETGAISDTSTHEESLFVNSGRRFTVTPWVLSAVNSEMKRSDDRGTLRERTVSADATYIINRQVSLIGGVGWENIEDPLLIDDPSGFTWRAGFALQGHRSSMRVTYGLQEDHRSVDFLGNYQFSSRTQVTASYNESIETSQSQILEDLRRLGFAPTPIDAPTGLPFSPGNEGFGLTDETFVQKRFELTLTGSRKRNVFSGQLSWERREFQTSGDEEVVFGGELRFTRTLSRRTTASAGVSVERSDFGSDEGKQTEYGFDVIYSYQVAEDAHLSLAYDFTLRDDEDAADDFYENAITAALSKTF